MRKLILFCTLSLLSLYFTACSSVKKLPDDFVVVLPDKQEIYIYMTRDEAEAVLGEGVIDENNNYCYDDIGLKVQYYKNELTIIQLENNTSCTIKSGINSSFKEENFVEADFIKQDGKPVKYYLIDKGKYTLINEKPENPSFDNLHQYLMIATYIPYAIESDPNYGKYDFLIGDLTCILYGSADE